MLCPQARYDTENSAAEISVTATVKSVQNLVKLTDEAVTAALESNRMIRQPSLLDICSYPPTHVRTQKKARLPTRASLRVADANEEYLDVCRAWHQRSSGGSRTKKGAGLPFQNDFSDISR